MDYLGLIYLTLGLIEAVKFPRFLLLSAGLVGAATGFAQTAAPASKASAPVAAASALSARCSPKASKTAAPTTAVAAGGGSETVWVNMKSNVYHCEGTKFYGKTKTGEHMTKADAKNKANRGDGVGVCAKYCLRRFQQFKERSGTLCFFGIRF